MDYLANISHELLSTIVSGGWVAFAGFGAFLAYKLALTTVVCGTVLRAFKVVIAYLEKRTGDTDQRLLQLVAAAGMVSPLTDEEWDNLCKRVKKK